MSCVTIIFFSPNEHVLLNLHDLSSLAGALITARKQARDRMTQEHISSEEYAVLDGRQKALKVLF